MKLQKTRKNFMNLAPHPSPFEKAPAPEAIFHPKIFYSVLKSKYVEIKNRKKKQIISFYSCSFYFNNLQYKKAVVLKFDLYKLN